MIFWSSQWLLIAALAAPGGAAGAAIEQAAEGDPKPAQRAPTATGAEPTPLSPWYIIVGQPKDLNELLLKIDRPDMVLKANPRGLDGANEKARLETSGTSDAARPIVEAVKVSGRVDGELASLTVDFQIISRDRDHAWCSIRLDDQWLLGAREAGRDLELQRYKKEWQVKLVGGGPHHVEVDLRVPIITESLRKTLSLAIPEAANTSVELDFSVDETDFTIGGNESFGRAASSDGKRQRLTAHLWPRSRLVVAWAGRSDASTKMAPILTAQGEIAIDLDSEQLRARASWVIRCVRGMTRELVIGIDEGDEITEMLLDDQAIEEGGDRVREGGRVTLRLAEPLRPGSFKRLVFGVRRTLAQAGLPAESRTLSLSGFPIKDAREQTGFIGVTQSANIWVSPIRTRGARRIDPSFLPRDLRERPGTSLAFEFLGQPFSLDLGLDPAPPLVRAETRTVFRIDSTQAKSQTTIELERVRGRLFEIELGVAPGLSVVAVGPASVIESSSIAYVGGSSEKAGDDSRARTLRLRLTPAAREESKITITLEGVQRVAGEGPVKLGLFRRDQSTLMNSSYALFAGAGLLVDLDDDSGSGEPLGSLKRQGNGAGRDWLPAAAGEATSPPLILSDDGSARYLPVKLMRQERIFTYQTTLAAQVSRRRVEVVEELELAVQSGVLTTAIFRVPAEIGLAWELVDKEVSERLDLGKENDGSRRFQLRFARRVTDRCTVRFRFVVPVTPAVATSASRTIAVPWISPVEGRAGPATVDLALEPDIQLKAVGPSWASGIGDDRAEIARDGASNRFVELQPEKSTGAFSFDLIALERAHLPSIVAPRLLLKTYREPDGTRRTRASYWVETHEADFPFALPTGARLIAARIDGRPVDAVDREEGPLSFRLRFAADLVSKPVLVELEYDESDAASRSLWNAPRVLEDGVVLMVFWEVWVPWNLEIVGVPAGWSDENQWHWDGYIWKQRPGKNTAILNEWLLGAGGPAAASDESETASASDSHRYLYSGGGPPRALEPWIVSRAWLVGICSGLTLLIGFAAIFSGLRFRAIWPVVAVLGVVVAALVRSSVAFLVVQSAFIGFVFAALGLVIQRSIERSRATGIPVRDSAITIGQQTIESSLNRAPGVGSDDSTAVRVRAPSTMDHAPASPADGQPASAEEKRGSSLERARP